MANGNGGDPWEAFFVGGGVSALQSGLTMVMTPPARPATGSEAVGSDWTDEEMAAILKELEEKTGIREPVLAADDAHIQLADSSDGVKDAGSGFGRPKKEADAVAAEFNIVGGTAKQKKQMDMILCALAEGFANGTTPSLDADIQRGIADNLYSTTYMLCDHVGIPDENGVYPLAEAWILTKPRATIYGTASFDPPRTVTYYLPTVAETFRYDPHRWGYLGAVTVHELAHTGGWQHGSLGLGVPGECGNIVHESSKPWIDFFEGSLRMPSPAEREGRR